MASKPRRPRSPKAAPLPKPARKLWTDDMARFDGCTDCVFYRSFHAHAACVDCTAGENFKEEVEELDPYAPSFLSRKSR